METITNRRAPIYSKKLYLCAGHSQRNTATGEWGPGRQVILVSGAQKRARGYGDAGPHGNCNAVTWEWDDGHLPGHRPQGTYAQACAWIEANPFSMAYPIPYAEVRR